MRKCPGQDTRYWTSEDIFDVACPVCDTPVEFMKTDPQRKCQNCGNAFRNPRLEVGCAQWCAYAEECLGFLPEEQAQELQAGPVAVDIVNGLKEQFGGDYERIANALRRFEHARRLSSKAGGVDARVVTAAALLYDIEGSVGDDERETGDQRCKDAQEARDILQRVGFHEGEIERVCEIVADDNGTEGAGKSEGQVVRDAARLVQLADRPQSEIEDVIAEAFETAAGKDRGRELFIRKQAGEPALPPLRAEISYRDE